MLMTMRGLLDLFAPLVGDTQTIDKLRPLIDDRSKRKTGHELFSEIRQKTLRASREQDTRAETQYLFEEVCAKSLYNMTNTDAPFDPDSPYWIIPTALALASELGLDEMQVVDVVTGRARQRN